MEVDSLIQTTAAKILWNKCTYDAKFERTTRRYEGFGSDMGSYGSFGKGSATGAIISKNELIIPSVSGSLFSALLLNCSFIINLFCQTNKEPFCPTDVTQLIDIFILNYFSDKFSTILYKSGY